MDPKNIKKACDLVLDHPASPDCEPDEQVERVIVIRFEVPVIAAEGKTVSLRQVTEDLGLELARWAKTHSGLVASLGAFGTAKVVPTEEVSDGLGEDGLTIAHSILRSAGRVVRRLNEEADFEVEQATEWKGAADQEGVELIRVEPESEEEPTKEQAQAALLELLADDDVPEQLKEIARKAGRASGLDVPEAKVAPAHGYKVGGYL